MKKNIFIIATSIALTFASVAPAFAGQGQAGGTCTASGTVITLDLTGYEYDGDDTNTVRITLDGVPATVSFGTELHYSSGSLNPARAHTATFRVTTKEVGSPSVTQAFAARVSRCAS